MNLFFPPKHSPATKLLIASFFGPIRGKNCGNYDFHVIKQLFKYRLSYCRLTQKDINCSNQDFFGSSCYQKKKLFTAVNWSEDTKNIKQLKFFWIKIHESFRFSRKIDFCQPRVEKSTRCHLSLKSFGEEIFVTKIFGALFFDRNSFGRLSLGQQNRSNGTNIHCLN